ncbi:Vacuolar protein sorting-associated protein 16, variant 2 [Entomophthora muscae]|nr:Vacuolar protein sorting-associated protein 16, variant 2 [Entomophthora muscae]
MGWDHADQLLLVFAEGIVRKYGIFGGMSQFSMGLDSGEEIRDAKFWPEGLVVCTSSWDFFVVSNYKEPRPRKLAPPAIQGSVHCWDMIPPEKALSQSVEVYLSAGNTVMAIDSKGAQDLLLHRGPFYEIAASPSGGFLALLTKDGNLLVVSANFQQKLLDHNLNESRCPNQLAWCGNEYILVLYDEDLVVVDPQGESETIFYDGGAFVCTEMDGARVFTNTQCEFLQKIPGPTQDIFGIGSTSPAALLFDALDHFEKKSPKADEIVRIIGENLEEAVDGCIAAAGHEWEPQAQKSLLKAASFGKCFLDSYNGDRFVRQCQHLRVLNALHHFEVGIPLTLAQMEFLGIDKVIERLLEIHQHFLSLKLCEYLHLPSDRVVIHWACSKIRASLDDEETTSRIVLDKIGRRPGLSYHHIAKVASENGQLHLAIKLLDREPNAQSQVPMLIEMQEDERALDKAIASGDTNLVYLVILQAKQKLSLGDFFRLINPRPMACSLLEAFCHQQDKQLLKDFYYQDDRRLALGLLAIRETYSAKDPDSFKNKWEEAQKNFVGIRDKANESKLMDEQVKLLALQEALATKAGQEAIGLPLADTVMLATKVGDHNLASKLRTDFKVSDKKFWWWKLKGHVAANDWDGLEAFAKAKKSPIGYRPFYDLCVSALQPSQAMKYALRCEASQRPSLFLKIQAYREAGQQAFTNKDLAFLKKIRAECPDNGIKRELDVWIVQLTSR